MFYNTLGSRNNAFGFRALYTNTTNNNNAFGYKALQNNTTGTNNSAFGHIALASNAIGNSNSAFGYQALKNNTTNNNSAFGHFALVSNTTGTGNSAFGYKAGSNITTGNKNIIIGYNINAPVATGNGQLNIANMIFGTGSYGEGTTVTTGSLGIGFKNPTSTLHVYGSGSNKSVFKVDGGNGTLFEVTDSLTGSLFSVNTIAGLPVIEAFSNNRVVMGKFNANDFVISGSRVGIGTNVPSAKLHIRGGTELLNTSGSTSITTSGSLMILGQNTRGGSTYHDFLYVRNTKSGNLNPQKAFRLNNSGSVEIVNNAYSTVIFGLTDAGVLSTPGGGTSDIRTKENVEYIYENTLPTITQLKPVKFEFKYNTGVKRHGFIAQDVLNVKPELVLGDGDKETGTYGLDYDGILALTVKALQEANEKIEKLEARVSQLENK